MSPDPSSWSTASDIPPGMSMPPDQAVPFDEVELRKSVLLGPYSRESVGMAPDLIKEALQKLCFL